MNEYTLTIIYKDGSDFTTEISAGNRQGAYIIAQDYIEDESDVLNVEVTKN